MIGCNRGGSPDKRRPSTRTLPDMTKEDDSQGGTWVRRETSGTSCFGHGTEMPVVLRTLRVSSRKASMLSIENHAANLV